LAASYAITFDAPRAILTIRAEGFWARETLDAFGNELISTMRALDSAGRRFTVLADASNFPVQSIPISLGFMGIVRRIDRHLLVPTAIVATGALLRLQALHVFVAPHIRVFGDFDTAYAWLAEKSAVPPAAGAAR
jgi:hypothetical protein